MPKTVSVQVEIPDGWELVTGAIGQVKEGDFILDNQGTATVAKRGQNLGLQLRLEWKWPKELGSKFAAVAQVEGGEWYATTRVPRLNPSGWWCDFDETVRLALFDWFTPPPCTDWKQSLRKNPNVKE